MGDTSDNLGRKGRGGGSAGRRSGKSGNIEYTRVVPKFLRHLVYSEENQYDTFKPLPSSSRTAKERDAGAPIEAELDALRRDGFLVDTPDAVAESSASAADHTPSTAEPAVGAEKSGAKSSVVKFPPPSGRHARNSSMKVAAHKIAKDTGRRKARDAFATKNRNKLSFDTNSDAESSSDGD